MLIEFSVKNFRSIKERQTFSMVAAMGNELRETNTSLILDGKLSVLHSAAIYGPNASGKSNLIRALGAMEKIVLRSARQGQRGDTLPITPYLFDSLTKTEPTEFEVLFIIDNVRYQYGFTATNERFFDEWLYAFPKGRPQAWIERKYDKDSGIYTWGKMEKLRGSKQLWQEATRSNSLFLSTAIQLNNKQLQPIYDWFGSTLRVIGFDTLMPSFSFEQSLSEPGKSKIMSLLKAADFAIHDLDIKTEQVELQKLFEDMPEGLRTAFLARMEDDTHVQRFDAKTVHLGREGEVIQLDLDEESDGTQKFFALAGPWLDILEEGYVAVVDELNNSLHPLLVKFLIQMFHDVTLNPKHAQLIFTTHETSILDQEMFRRDQIWFTEKDELNATRLYPLSDFSPRKGVENLGKNYLQGRYGALPYFREITKAFDGAEL